ncbi:CHAT domain-containing protein [Fodinibius salsisoli]|uniref:CHAT domain-containing protein n=1 Tax=Fodinibius salsisoli TaxID=2820877 RepID=A0ABT3PIL6_9BACT|nr:CHAT domain-containing tetratricopeptide repeat protein [Fodinibius salsisoli]MCW9705593.1 CHAT domain-containing protein [Fodinibius salsisoli]
MNKRWLLFFGMLLGLPLALWGQSVQLADSLLQQGKQYDQGGNMEQAEFYYREAYQIYRNFQDTTSWLEAGKEYASAMVYRSKNEEAMTLYKMLLNVDHPANDAYNRGDLYNSMGWSSSRIGKTDEALSFYQKSMPLAEQSGDSLLIGVVYDNLGSVFNKKGNLGKALEYSQKALLYFQGLGNKKSIAITLNNIGSIYKALSLYEKALEYYTKSIGIRKELNNVFMMSVSYGTIASIQRELGNYSQALTAYQKSLKYSQQAGVPQRIGLVLNNIGLLYKTLGEYEKAKDYYRQSLAMKEKVAGPQSIATTTKNLGKLLWEQGQTQEAATYFKKALALRKEVGNPYDIASSLNTMVELALEEQKFEQARVYASQIKSIGDSTESYEIRENASAYLGEINAAEGKDESALTHYKKAYAYSTYLPRNNRLGILKQLARQYHKLNSDSAVVYGQKAVDIIEEGRGKAGAVSNLKTGYFKKHSDFYTELASWVLNYTQDTPRAFTLVEQAKARSFSDDLAKATQNIEQQLPEEVRIQRNEKQNRIDSLYTQLERAPDAQQQARISEQIRTTELNYAAYENRLKEEYPVLQKLDLPEPIALQRAQSLTDDQTAVLEYAVAGNELILFLIGQDEVRVEQFSYPANQSLDSALTARVTAFRDGILANADKTQLQSQSGELYEILIAPFEQSLKEYENLIIVPDGALAYLPFEALLQDDRYLIENFKIKYEPSLTSLELLEEASTKNRKELLAVAGSQSSDGGSALSSSRLSALPSTLIEVDSIASHFQQVSMLKDEQVSEQAFKNLLQQSRYQYVHMATHGVIDEERPGRSGLALSTEGDITASSREDGMLRSSEIFGLNMSSDMVVLSACNTGLGKVVRGEGMLGMQRSFFYAGASTVVVSLWSVYDRSTASLMNEFYKALIEGKGEEGWVDATLRWVGWDTSIPFGEKATAMRQAKLQMINHPLFNHPVYWAPFIVVGR